LEEYNAGKTIEIKDVNAYFKNLWTSSWLIHSIKKSRKLCLKNSKLRSTLIKQFSLFNEDPTHPSLKLHKLQGKRSEHYAVWIISDLRAIAVKSGDKFIFFDLITHDEY
jgi:mRNA-degrading endonuclease YafQ of YafQ-DinJ toxin-antitoxin module